MKHEPILTFEQRRQNLIGEWLSKKPAREDFPSWDAWMKARSLWNIDMFHALERFDSAERRQRIFA